MKDQIPPLNKTLEKHKDNIESVTKNIKMGIERLDIRAYVTWDCQCKSHPDPGLQVKKTLHLYSIIKKSSTATPETKC